MSFLDTVNAIRSAGLPVPEKVIIPQPKVDDTGKVYVGLGWQFSGDMEAGGWIKVRPKSKEVAAGVVAVLEGLRKEASLDDPDSPGVLTASEVFEVLTGVALGKR